MGWVWWSKISSQRSRESSRKGCMRSLYRQDWRVNSPKCLFGDPWANLVLVLGTGWPGWSMWSRNSTAPYLEQTLSCHCTGSAFFRCTAMHNCPPTVLMIAPLPNLTSPDMFMSHKNENLGCNMSQQFSPNLRKEFEKYPYFYYSFLMHRIHSVSEWSIQFLHSRNLLMPLSRP